MGTTGTISGTIYYSDTQVSGYENIYLYSNYNASTQEIGAKLPALVGSTTSIINGDEASFSVANTTTDSDGKYSFTGLTILDSTITYAVYHTKTTYTGLNVAPTTSEVLVEEVPLSLTSDSATVDWRP